MGRTWDVYYKAKKLDKGTNAGDIILEVPRPEWYDVGSRILTGIIQEVTKGIFTHVAIKVKDGDMIEALMPDIAVRSFKTYVEQKKIGLVIFRHKNLTEDMKKLLLTFLYAREGAKYDLPGLFSYILPWCKPEKHDNYCSELPREAYHKLDIDITPGIKTPSPNDVFRCLLKHPDFCLVDSQNIDLDKLIKDIG